LVVVARTHAVETEAHTQSWVCIGGRHRSDRTEEADCVLATCTHLTEATAQTAPSLALKQLVSCVVIQTSIRLKTCFSVEVCFQATTKVFSTAEDEAAVRAVSAAGQGIFRAICGLNAHVHFASQSYRRLGHYGARSGQNSQSD